MNKPSIFFLLFLILGFAYLSYGVSQIKVHDYEFTNFTYNDQTINLNGRVVVENPSWLGIPVNVEYKTLINDQVVDTFNKSYHLDRQATTTIDLSNSIDRNTLSTLAKQLITEEKVILKIEGTATAITLIANKRIPIYYEIDIKEYLVGEVKNTISEKLGDLINLFN